LKSTLTMTLLPVTSTSRMLFFIKNNLLAELSAEIALSCTCQV
jgi:hypothetical protein